MACRQGYSYPLGCFLACRFHTVLIGYIRGRQSVYNIREGFTGV